MSERPAIDTIRTSLFNENALTIVMTVNPLIRTKESMVTQR